MAILTCFSKNLLLSINSILIKLIVSKWIRVIITSKITISFALLFVLATVMMSSMVSNVDAAPFIGIFFWKVWYCLKVPCFNWPTDLAIDSSGNVFVTDLLNQRIEKISSTGGFISTWGTYGTGNGQFKNPWGVAVDKSGNVFVSDEGNDRIQEFKNDGTFIRTWGTYGTGNGQFKAPEGVAVDPTSDTIFVADTFNHRVQKFQLATACPKGTEITSGVCFIKKWGSHGTANGQYDQPHAVDVDYSGNVFVADALNHRIQKFKNDGSFVTTWGTEGSGDGQFFGPFGLAVDKSGIVFVADAGSDRIQKFKNDGGYIRKWGSTGTGNGQFDYLNAVAVEHSTGNVFAADQQNNRIQKFTNTGDFLTKWGTKGPWD